MLHHDEGPRVSNDESLGLRIATLSALVAHEKNADLKWQAMEMRVASLENWQTWAMRIVLSLVIVAVVGVVLIER